MSATSLKHFTNFVSAFFLLVSLFFLFLLIYFCRVFILPDMIVGNWIHYILWRTIDTFYFWFINFTYLFLLLSGAGLVSIVNFFVPTNLNVYRILSKHYIDDFYQYFSTDLFWFSRREHTLHKGIEEFFHSNLVLSPPVDRLFLHTSRNLKQLVLCYATTNLGVLAPYSFTSNLMPSYLYTCLLDSSVKCTPLPHYLFYPKSLFFSKEKFIDLQKYTFSDVRVESIYTNHSSLIKTASNVLRTSMPGPTIHNLLMLWTHLVGLKSTLNPGFEFKSQSLFYGIKRASLFTNLNTNFYKFLSSLLSRKHELAGYSNILPLPTLNYLPTLLGNTLWTSRLYGNLPYSWNQMRFFSKTTDLVLANTTLNCSGGKFVITQPAHSIFLESLSLTQDQLLFNVKSTLIISAEYIFF